MRFGYDLIILDLEINNPNSSDEEIIEIGAVKFLRDGTIYPFKFTRLILPTLPLTDHIKQLTGITDKEITDYGMPLSDVIDHLFGWATKESKNLVFAGWGNDVSFLRSYLEKRDIEWPFRGKSLDIKSMAIFAGVLFNKEKKSDGLGSTLGLWGLEFDTKYGSQHRGLPDAYNTALLLKTIMESVKEERNNMLKSLQKLGLDKTIK